MCNSTIISESCQCGSVSFSLSLSKPIESYTPKACDCNFCIQRNIAYLSDPNSQLKITNKKKLKHYQQGSKQALFLACQSCDDVIAVVIESNKKVIGAVNANLVSSSTSLKFAKQEPSSPKLLSAKDKFDRWKTIWMEISYNT